MTSGAKLVVAVAALAIAGGTAYTLYASNQKKAQQERVAALVAETTVLLRKALAAPPAPEALARIDDNLKAASAPRDRPLADAAGEYIHGAREIVRRRGDAERLTREAAMSRRALAMHMAAASSRDTYWFRIATDLKKRVERDHSELEISLKVLGELLYGLPEAQKRLAPQLAHVEMVGYDEALVARQRAQESAKRAQEELEKVRRLALPR